jgi:Rieske 2Fe-2S family protein
VVSVGADAIADDRIDALILAQRPGHSLDQALYVDAALFRRDRECIFGNQWILAGHVSQIPEPGDYLLFDLAGESIILIRDRQGAVHAHYNVCRHRGSRVLLDPAGNRRTLVCRRSALR